MQRDDAYYERLADELANDDYSSDEELHEWLMKEYGASPEEATALLDVRGEFLRTAIVFTDDAVMKIAEAMNKANGNIDPSIILDGPASNRSKNSNMKINKLNYFAEYAKVDKTLFDEAMLKAHDMLNRITSGGTNWAQINANETLSKIAANQFESLELLLQEVKGNKSEGKRETVKRQAPVRRPAAVKPKPAEKQHPGSGQQHHAPSVKQTVKSINKHAPKMKQGKPVETVDPHLAMLTRYRKLHGKTVPKDKIRVLAAALVKQIEARILRKKSEYSGTIEEMRTHIFKLMHKKTVGDVAVNIPEKTLTAIDKAITSEHKMKSVQLLNRYAGMAGRLTTIAKAKKLYNDMYSAITNDSVPQDDRYFDRITDTMKNLKAYVEDEDESTTLELLPAELSGILGCGCKKADHELNGIDYPETFCEEDETEADKPERKTSGPIPSTEFMKQHFDRYHIDEPWVKVFGHIEPGKHTVVFSKEKLGKTTTLVDFAGYLSTHHGPVLFIQKEEELSGTFQDKFEQTQAANPNLFVDEDLPVNPNELRKYKFLFLDSVSRLGLTPSQLVALQKRLGPGTTIFAILHATKDGQHRGANDYVHDAAHIVEFPEFGAAQGRGRFKGHTGELVRFAEPRQ